MIEILNYRTINPGASRFSGKLYPYGSCKWFYRRDDILVARISGQCFKNAHIRINGVSDSYTSFSLQWFKDSEIFLDKGDMIYV